MNHSTPLEVTDNTVEPMTGSEERDNARQSRTLAAVNFCVAVLSITYLTVIFLDNLWFTGAVSLLVPRGCIENLYCKFTARMPNPGGQNFLYLRFGNLHQNFKDYTASFSPRVFKDNINPSMTQVKSCKPLLTNADMNKTFDHQGNQLKPLEVAIPCGAIAYTYPDSSMASH